MTIVAHNVGSVGGMERVLTELIVGLADRGHQVTVIARTCEVTPHKNVAFCRVRGPNRPFMIAYCWFLIAGSIAVRRWRRGVVQATGAIVVNRVDCISVHYCHQVGRSTASRQSLVFRLHAHLSGRLKRFAERRCFTANRGARFICVSNGVADEMRKHYPELSGRVLTIHNGVDTDRFHPSAHEQAAVALRARLRIPKERLTAVFVGSEWGRKGLEPLIRALALTKWWDLLVVGAGEKSHFRSLAQALGVDGAVHFLGVREDVEIAYAASDAFVLPSAYETFSLVTFEAAASGLPVLVPPLSGVSEMIREGESGFFITQDPQMIATRLDLLRDDAELRSRMGEVARQAALRFGWETMVERHEQLYRRGGKLDNESAPDAIPSC